MLTSFDPATGEVVGAVPVTPVETIPGIVARGRAAQASWADLGAEGRATHLRRAAAQLDPDAIGRLVTREMGKPLKEAIGEARTVVRGFDALLDEVLAALTPEVTERNGVRTTVHHDAFGVAACITPWNFPVLMPHEQLLPALAAGNAVVFKPSEETPLVGQAYADAFLSSLPDGVLQVVHGDEAQGKALVASDVDLIVFTGSRAAGKDILAEASKTMKRVILELGGKDPLLVLVGADIEGAARFASRNCFRNAGQVCVSTERIYVEAPVHDAFVEALGRYTAKMNVGPGTLDSTAIGPMVNARQKAHVLRQVASARAQGATVAHEGAPLEGNYLAPIILTECRQDMDITREETFGPVACVYRVADDAEAVRLANDTRYGLGAVVYGPDDRARRVARRLTAGMIGVNQGLTTAGSAPWVGARESGYGFHSGRDGHRQFAQVRVISERTG